MFRSLLVAFALILVSQDLAAQTPEADTLRILTWNVQFLPRIAGGYHRNARLPGIIQTLRTSNYDVVCLQEVFDTRITKILVDSLSSTFPSVVAPVKVKGKLTTSGVMLLSRTAIAKSERIVYTQHKGIDGMAAKGCTFGEVAWQGQLLQFFGTHAQADEGAERDAIRSAQYGEMNTLMQKYYAPTIPQFVLGDLNTDQNDAPNYERLLEKLPYQDLSYCADCFTHNDRINDYSGPKPKAHILKLDYVLYRPSLASPSFKLVKSSVKRFRFLWGKGHSDLSDHYAVEVVLVKQ
jgi:endonuclease/exonuclease/phosphatase family metal-dependent hydrolase